MITFESMSCGVTCLPQVVEQHGYIPFKIAVALHTTQKLQLAFFAAGIETKTRCNLLGQQLPKLPQLDQSRIGVIREVTLCITAQTKQGFVVGGDMGEVALHLTSVFVQ